MKRIIIIFLFVIYCHCSNHNCFKKIKTQTYNDSNLIYGTWILEKFNYFENYDKDSPLDNEYDRIKIRKADKFKKIDNQVAFLQTISLNICITEIISKYPEYKLKFKYSESETLDSDGRTKADWLEGEIIMHFINKDEVWFELVYAQNGKRKTTWLFNEIIKYGKDNVYKRKK